MPISVSELERLGFNRFGHFVLPGGYGAVWVRLEDGGGDDGLAYWELLHFDQPASVPVGSGVAPSYAEAMQTLQAVAQFWIASGVTVREWRERNQVRDKPPPPPDLGFLSSR